MSFSNIKQFSRHFFPKYPNSKKGRNVELQFNESMTMDQGLLSEFLIPTGLKHNTNKSKSFEQTSLLSFIKANLHCILCTCNGNWLFSILLWKHSLVYHESQTIISMEWRHNITHKLFKVLCYVRLLNEPTTLKPFRHFRLRCELAIMF